MSFLFFQNAQALFFEKDSEENDTSFSSSLAKSLYPVMGIPLTLKDVFQNQERQKTQKRVVDFCEKVNMVYKRLNWLDSSCLRLPWKFDYVSERGEPLVYLDFHDSLAHSDALENTTVILGGVHPDEINPIHMVFQLADTFDKKPDLYKNSRVIIAPLVNPDGFFSKPFKRTNANGIDLNRNFPTQIWSAQAYDLWSEKKNKDMRNFPGFYANSEQGTRFQIALIDAYNPDKVISIHAPLGFLDVDYEYQRLLKSFKLTDSQQKARQLGEMMSKSAGNYKLKDFGVYPGSLGNYAGNERVIPTITLELSSSSPKMAQKFWKDFSPGIIDAVHYEFRKNKWSTMDAFSIYNAPRSSF